jgi:hypothetical protein
MLVSEFRGYTKAMGCHDSLNFGFSSRKDCLDKYSFTRLSALFGYDRETFLRLFFNFTQEEDYKVEYRSNSTLYSFTAFASKEGVELLNFSMSDSTINIEIANETSDLLLAKMASDRIRIEPKSNLNIEELSSFIDYFADIINENKTNGTVKKVLIDITTHLNCKLEEVKLTRSDAWKSDQELIEIKDFFDKLARVVEYSDKSGGLDLKQFLETGNFNSQDPVCQGFANVFKIFTSRIQDKADGPNYETQTWINREKRRRELIDSTFPNLQ